MYIPDLNIEIVSISDDHIKINGVLFKRQRTEDGRYPEETRREYMRKWHTVRKQKNECSLERKESDQ